MQIFIDTANVKEIKAAHEMGIISGVTTNPSIIAKEGKSFKDAVKEIVDIVGDSCVVFCEVISTEAPGMIEEARELVKLHSRVVVKFPMCAESLKAISVLSKEGIKTCVTLCFSAAQALLAASAGASYVAPFVGRVDDIGWDGCALIEEIAEIFAVQNMDTQIVVASTRNPVHVINVAKAGANVATIPYKVLMQMVEHPLSTSGLEKFLKDWESVPKQ